MKRFLILFVSLSIFLSSTFLIAQELPEVIPPSPTVANLMQFEEVPVSYYTGQPNISIPIYSKALNGDLNLNIGLSYNTQGVKINNRSGWTGTSWSLNAGGVISRTVRGEPDEITKSSSSTNKTGIYHLNDYWNYSNLTGDQKRDFNFFVIGDIGNKYDNKPDLYQFNFMGYTGRFVILKEGITLVPKFISKSNKFKIEFTHDSNYVISAFTVIDPKGYKYTFDIVETSLTTSTTGSIAQGTSVGVIPISQSPPYSANSAWHLSKIETSNGLDLATFSYQNVFENYAASVSRTTKRISNASEMSNYNAFIANPYNQSVLEPLESVSYQIITSTTKKLNTITFTRDNVQILFDIDPNYIHPETNGRVLQTITIKRGNDINKTFDFTYEETSDTSIPTLNLKRVWLTKVTETASDTSQDYILSYKNKENLPGFNNNDIRGDSWGYYSGINDSQLGCSINLFDEDIVRTGLLSSIEYPTGGVKEFVFEHNSYSYYQDQLLDIEDYQNNPRNIVSATPIFINDFVYTNGVSPFTSDIATFTLDFEQDIYISSWVTANPSQYLSNHIVTIYNSNNTYWASVDLNDLCGIIPNVPAGTYTLALEIASDLLLDTYTITGDYRINYSQSVSQPKQEMIGGGVRIKDIIFKNRKITLDIEKQISFVYDDENNSNLSSGVIDSKADRLERRYKLNTDRWTFGFEESVPGSLMIRTIQYDVIEKIVNVELTQGSYVGYRNVKVLERHNGYSTYSYTSPYEYPSLAGTFNFEQPKPKEHLDYKRGLLLTQKTFNESGNILKEVSYLDNLGNPNYGFDEDLLFNDKSVFKPNTSCMQLYSDYDFWISGTVQNPPICDGLGGNCGFPMRQPFCGAFPVIGTDFKSGWAKLLGTTTKDYFYDSQNNVTVKESRQTFTYNTFNYQISQQDTYYKEKGIDEHYSTEYFYPNDNIHPSSSNTAIRSQLIGLNKVNEVLETETFKNGIKVSQTNTIYNEFETDLILPQQVETAKGTDTPEERIKFYEYDSYGNPLEVSKTGGTPISYVWGYDQTLPVAKVVNATYSDIESLPSFGVGFSLTAGLSTAQENDLRGLVEAQISTFEYDPMVGVISTTDARGYTIYYYYDEFNRLEYVKDEDGNILSKNEYNYKN